MHWVIDFQQDELRGTSGGVQRPWGRGDPVKGLHLRPVPPSPRKKGRVEWRQGGTPGPEDAPTRSPRRWSPRGQDKRRSGLVLLGKRAQRWNRSGKNRAFESIFLSSQSSFPLVFRSYFILTYWNNDNTSVLFQRFVTICNVWEIWKSTFSFYQAWNCWPYGKMCKTIQHESQHKLAFLHFGIWLRKKVTFIRSQAM